jgi:hypothetical protein
MYILNWCFFLGRTGSLHFNQQARERERERERDGKISKEIRTLS